MPGVLRHFVKVARHAPVQLAIGLFSVRPVGREVAFAARREVVVNRFAAGFAKSVDHVEHAAADACAKVIDMHAGFISQFFHRRDVAVGQVHHVNVVAHAGAIFGWVVVAEYRQRFTTADRDLRDIRHQVVRDALRIFTHIARRMRADRVEVAQQRDAPVRLRFLQVSEDLLDHQLAFTVRALRSPGREAFDIRDFWLVAVHGGGGAENKVFHARGAHGGNEFQCAGHVVVVVFQRLGDGFADGFQAGEMDHRFNSVIVKDFRHQRFVTNVAFDKGGAFPAETFNDWQYAAFTVAEIVENNHFVSLQ